MSELKYVSSAGIKVILATHKMVVDLGELTVRSLRDIMMEVPDATGFTDVLYTQ